jgi:hypothetical protein
MVQARGANFTDVNNVIADAHREIFIIIYIISSTSRVIDLMIDVAKKKEKKKSAPLVQAQQYSC